jgi:hypothetical protein
MVTDQWGNAVTRLERQDYDYRDEVPFLVTEYGRTQYKLRRRRYVLCSDTRQWAFVAESNAVEVTMEEVYAAWLDGATLDVDLVHMCNEALIAAAVTAGVQENGYSTIRYGYVRSWSAPEGLTFEWGGRVWRVEQATRPTGTAEFLSSNGRFVLIANDGTRKVY